MVKNIKGTFLVPSTMRPASWITGLVLMAAAFVGVLNVLDHVSGDTIASHRYLKLSARVLADVTSTELQAHNRASDCWVAIHGNVYDLTSYTSRHPGGPGVISSRCGADATNAFVGQGHSPSYLDAVSSSLIGAYLNGNGGGDITGGGGGGAGNAKPLENGNDKGKDDHSSDSDEDGHDGDENDSDEDGDD